MSKCDGQTVHTKKTKGVSAICVLIIGGDYLGNIKENLKKEVGATDIKHVSGRKKSASNMELSSNLDMVVVLTDYINHQMCLNIKRQARCHGIKTIFARRSWAHLKKALEA